MGEILDLGYRNVELNYKITGGMMETIRPMVSAGEIRVPSVHNVFPDAKDPRFDTDSRLLGYPDDELRRASIELTKATVDEAVRLGVRAVVIHPGELPAAENPPGPSGLRGKEYELRFRELYQAGGSGTQEFTTLREEFLGYRRRIAGPELERILNSLEEICEHVVRRGYPIQIGLENRPMVHQFPDFVELDWFLEKLAGAPVGLWFDTGHGKIMRNYGFFDDRIEATKRAGTLVGVHIHDTVGIDDHWAPYAKSDEIDDYLDIILAAPVRVLELGKKNSAELSAAGGKKLSERLAKRLAERMSQGSLESGMHDRKEDSGSDPGFRMARK